MAERVDVREAQRHLEWGRGQVRFAAASALTATAKGAQQDVKSALPTIFDRPTRFTLNAIAILPARKTNLQAWVIVKDQQAGYLALQETGGTRRPAPGAPVLVPVNIRTNASGNIPRGKIAREMAKPNTFAASGRAAATRHLAPGIYQRFKQPRGKGAGSRKARPPKLLVAFEKQAAYRPVFGFEQRVIRVAVREFPGNFVQSLQRALATAR